MIVIIVETKFGGLPQFAVLRNEAQGFVLVYYRILMDINEYEPLWNEVHIVNVNLIS